MIPEIADDPTKMSQVFEQKSQYLLNQPRYKLQDNAGAKTFGGSIQEDKSLAFITNSKGNQDFSQFTSGQLFTPGAFPPSAMQATKDIFLNQEQLKADSTRLIAGGDVYGRTGYNNKKRGMSHQALVESQLKLNGLP